MNLPNQLTIARFFLTILFVVALSSEWHFRFTAGLLLFIAAGVTDYLDGEIARRRNLVTDFGKLMDPLADKIMISAAFICLVPLQAIPAWAAIVIISREFLITGLRLLAASKGIVLPSERLGKHKTVWQIITVIFFLLLLSLWELELADRIHELFWWAHAWKWGGNFLTYLAVALTLYSGGGYCWKNRSLISWK
jgi:CDP-diacylglycerol--glycerol-3-phosphate 3-phosphatidyltransferase